MFRHTSRLQFESKPDQPDPVYAHKLQELIGGAYGEMTVAMQYLFQGWNCRMPGKYKDLIMDIATEEIGHVEMIATMVARLLEGAPATATTKAAAADPVVGAVLGGMDPQQVIVSGGGALPADSNGYPWNGRYIVASGNLLADFRANAAAEAQGRLQTARLYNMTDDNGVRDMLRFNLARDTLHQNLWLKAIEELQADGLETTVAPNALFDEEYAEHATSIWHLSDGTHGQDGGWASGLQPDGTHEFDYLVDAQPFGDVASAPAPDPKLYATYNGAMGKPSGPALGTEASLAGKIKDKLTKSIAPARLPDCPGAVHPAPRCTAPGSSTPALSRRLPDGPVRHVPDDQSVLNPLLITGSGRISKTIRLPQMLHGQRSRQETSNVHPPPEIRTPQEELLGTTTGIIVTAIVACLGLGALLFPVFWAARPPKERLLRKTDDGAQIGDPDSIMPSQGDSHGQWPSERLEDRHVPEGGHPHGKLSSWILVTVVTAAFITGGVAIITHIWWLFWACTGIAVLAIPAGKAIGIMDDTVAWGSNPAASYDPPQDHQAGAQREQQTALRPESGHNRIKPP